MENFMEYIGTLENAGKKLTEAEWRNWIDKEQDDIQEQDERFVRLSESDVSSIIDTLAKDGFIKY